MNYNVYVNGVPLPRVDTMITMDGGHLWFRQVPPVGAQVTIQVQNGWNQGFIGNGICDKFPLTDIIKNSIIQDNEQLKYKQILHDAMRQLDNEIVRTEIDRLATVIAMVRDYANTN